MGIGGLNAASALQEMIPHELRDWMMLENYQKYFIDVATQMFSG